MAPRSPGEDKKIKRAKRAKATAEPKGEGPIKGKGPMEQPLAAETAEPAVPPPPLPSPLVPPLLKLGGEEIPYADEGEYDGYEEDFDRGSVVVGIDEAGYGPHLGPLVIAVSVFRAPLGDSGGAWWTKLKPTVQQAKAKNASLVVDDSKRILARREGPKILQRTLNAFLGLHGFHTEALPAWLSLMAPEAVPSLQQEHWFIPAPHQETKAAPSAKPSAATIAPANVNLKKALACAQLEFLGFYLAVVFPKRFNAMLAKGANKAELELALINYLLRKCLAEYPDEPMNIYVDRLGGRCDYSALVAELADPAPAYEFLRRPHESNYYFFRKQNEQEATGIAAPPGAEKLFPLFAPAAEEPLASAGNEDAITAFVNTARENNADKVTLSFKVRADQTCFPVALASMMAKCVREKCMAEFNRFWQAQIPGLKPTAGYPGDAKRFYQQIEAHLPALGLIRADLWRNK